MKVEVNVLGFVPNNTVSVDVKQHFHGTVNHFLNWANVSSRT